MVIVRNNSDYNRNLASYSTQICTILCTNLCRHACWPSLSPCQRWEQNSDCIVIPTNVFYKQLKPIIGKVFRQNEELGIPWGRHNHLEKIELKIDTIFISELITLVKMTILLTPTFILASAFMAFVLQVMRNLWFDVPLLTNVSSTETEAAITRRNLNILQSHPRCGLTFDKGREECWWGCDRKTNSFGTYYLTVIFIFEQQLSLSQSNSHSYLK